MKKTKFLLTLLGVGLLAGCDGAVTSSAGASSGAGTSSVTEVSSATSDPAVSGEPSVSAPSSVPESSIPEEETYTVTFRVGEDESQTEVSAGSTVTRPQDPVLEGHRFDGWFREDGTEFDFETEISGPVTLIAHFTSYEDIACTVKWKLPSGYRISAGYIYSADLVYQGHYNEAFVLPEIVSAETSDYTIGDTVSVYDRNNELIGTYATGDTIVLTSDIVIRLTGSVRQVEVSFGASGDDFASAVVDADESFTLPEAVPEDTDGCFIGWYIEGSQINSDNPYEMPVGVYQPGETVDADTIRAYDSIRFLPYCVDDSAKVDVSTFEELLSVDCEAIVNILNDIDAEGADVGTGMGDGEFNGIILGNGHTISNFTCNADGDQINGTGLIDLSGSGFQCYDLTLENVVLHNNYAMFGCGALIGEADNYSIVSNVTVTNVSIGIFTTYYNYNGEHWTMPSGVGGIAGTASGFFSNCAVDGFDTSTLEDDFDTNTESNQSLIIGGITGSIWGYGSLPTVFRNCRTTSSQLVAKNITGAVIGGIIGDFYAEYGGEIYGCTVENTTVRATEMTLGPRSDLLSTTTSLGGIAGYIDNESYHIRDAAGNAMPIRFSDNTVANSTRIRYDSPAEDDSAIIHAGGFAGDFTLNSKMNQYGTMTKSELSTVISGNKIYAEIAVTSNTDNFVKVGGFTAILDIYNRGKCSTIFENNEITNNIHVGYVTELFENTVYYCQAAGFAAYTMIQDTADFIVKSLVVKGTIDSPDSNLFAGVHIDSASEVSGVFCHLLVGEPAYLEFDDIYVDVSFTILDYASFIYYFEADAYMDGDGATDIVFGDIYVDSRTPVGYTNSGYCTPIEITDAEAFFLLTDFDAAWWDVSAGEVILK